MIENPSEFINAVPHVSFVYGQEQVDFLKSRYEGMSAHPFFSEMEYTEDREVIRQWTPLLVEGREDMPVAATRMQAGTDVDFGELSRKLIHWLGRQDGCAFHLGHRVTDLNRCPDGWELTVRDLEGDYARDDAGRRTEDEWMTYSFTPSCCFSPSPPSPRRNDTTARIIFRKAGSTFTAATPDSVSVRKATS